MSSSVTILLLTLAVLFAVPVLIFCVEIVAAVALPNRDHLVSLSKRPCQRVAVLVPAHNEGVGLLATLTDIKAQLSAGDRLLVVADNCTDDTAGVAMSTGAEVINRNDPSRKGKGYALASGLNHLKVDPPDTVIIVDADCRLADGTIDCLAAACAATNRPVQALDLMIARNESPIESRFAEFAWRVKNWVRPLGLAALGLPCQLMGTGMAFPWNVIRSVDLASGSIVEDLKLGLDLALAGNFPIFCPSASVTSDFPLSAKGAQRQRLRWERGHLAMILRAGPRLIFVGIRRADWDLCAMALDMAVPPLTLLGMLVTGMFVVTSLATLLGISSTAMLVSTASLAGLIAAIFLSWLKFGRELLSPRTILSMPSYVIRKFPIYGQILFRKAGSQWIKTDRHKE